MLFSSKSENEKQGVLFAFRGGSHMYPQVQDYIDKFILILKLIGFVNGWVFFSKFDMLLVVSEKFLNGNSLYFDLHNDGRLRLGLNDCKVIEWCNL